MTERRSSSRARLFIPLIGGLLTVSSATAQEQLFCSAGDIEDALSGLECVADGAYISPESVIEGIADRCAEALTERGCRRCFKKGRGKIVGALKGLAKLGIIDRSLAADIKDALKEGEEDVCADPGEDNPSDGDDNAPPPNPENPPAPENPGDGAPPPEFTPPPLPDGFPFDPPFSSEKLGRGGR